MSDTITIAGHRAEAGSEAEKHLRNAAWFTRRAAHCRRIAQGTNASHHERSAANELRQATKAPGYLGPEEVKP